MRFSENDTCKFVELFREQECLWNTSSINYRNRQMKQAALQTIVNCMNIDDFTVEDVKTKIKSLRGTYNQELTKIIKSTRSGAGGNDVYTPTLKWFSMMDAFLRQVKEKRTTISNLVLENSDIATGSSDDAANTNPDDAQFINPDDAPFIPDDAHIIPNDGSPGVANIIGSDNGSILENEKDAASSQHPSVKAKSPKISTPHGNRKRRYEELTSAVHELKNISELLNDEEEDEYDAFGRFVSLSLRKLPLTSSIEAQSEIQKILAMHKLSHFHSTSHTTEV